jgi:hypothetical protein
MGKEINRTYANIRSLKIKETYQRERKEILRPDWVASTSSMPLVYDRTMPEKPLGKVSTLRDFLRSCIELMKDETDIECIM